jgi:predicted dehydrogenase
MEAMWTRFLPAMAELRALLAAGAVGEIRYLMADLGTDTGPEPDARVASTELGGGALLQKGVYLVSLASMLLGRPDRIVSLADAGPTGVDEHSAVVLGYPDHRLAVLLTSIGTRTRREGVVVGSTGQVRIHAPVLCPSTLSVSTRPHRRRAGTGDDGAASGMAARLISYGKRNRLLRRLRERYWSLGERLVHGVRTRVIRAPVLGEGLHYQACEVMRCLRAGRLESETMPLDESVQVMETLDLIREQWSAVVPADSRASQVDRAI